MRKLSSIFILLLISVFSTYSQNIKHDYSLSCDSALSTYNKYMHNENNYFIGREYKVYHNYKQDNPYLNSRHGKGTIYSKGYVYSNKIIIYDIYTDEIAENTFSKSSGNVNVKLQKMQIDSFAIEFDNHHYMFTHIRNNKTSHNQVLDGFYEIPYKGKYQLVLKHIAEKGDSEGITTYTHKVDNFLKIGNAYYNINRKKKFLALFSAYKKQVKRKHRLFKTSYKELTTTQLIDLIKYAESL